MNRNRVLLSIVVIVVVGFLIGWFLQAWWQGSRATSPVDPAAATSTETPVTSGFCCLQAGNTCAPVESAGVCFRSGGEAFNTVQRNCNYYCVNIKP